MTSELQIKTTARVRLMALVSGLVLAAGLARADLIARWDNDPLAGNEATAAATTLGTNIDSAELGRGAGGTGTAYSDTFAMRNAHSNTLAGAISGNRYLTISVAADSGYALAFTNVFIRLQAQNATDYDVHFTLFAGDVGYAEGDELVTWNVGGTGNSADWLGQPRSLDLSGVTELQGVTSADFRLYIWGQDGGSFAQTGIGRAFTTDAADDLAFTGTISVVPEPGTLAFMGLGSLALLLQRRRRR